MSLFDSRDGCQYVALDTGHFGAKVHRKRKGEDWLEISCPAFDEGQSEVAVQAIWELSLANGPSGSLWAGTLAGGLFHTSNAGDSWELNTALWNDPKRKGWFGGG